MADLFSPPVEQWQGVSVRLRDLRRVLFVVPCAVAAVVGVVLVQLLLGWWWLSAVLVLLALAVAMWGWFWAARNQRAWGYAENADDLYVTRGVMWRRLVAVPYGRMQFVDVSAGPLERFFGVATVTLHTASTETAADIPGLPPEEATRLRNRLTELGEARGAGL
ncbi:MAG: PH domain-containing protein [Nocardioidaceae bacterium]